MQYQKTKKKKTTTKKQQRSSSMPIPMWKWQGSKLWPDCWEIPK
jgi:hypothetical protein